MICMFSAPLGSASGDDQYRGPRAGGLAGLVSTERIRVLIYWLDPYPLCFLTNSELDPVFSKELCPVLPRDGILIRCFQKVVSASGFSKRLYSDPD